MSQNIFGSTFKNLYGEGSSSELIIDLLKNIDISQNIIQKQITY